MKCAQEIIFSTVRHDDNLEFLIIDDTVCKKYGMQSEMVCYNHSTMLGTVLSHDYVTGLYLCGDICLPSSARLYGNPKKCNEKGIPFRTKIQVQRDYRSTQADSQKDGNTDRFMVYRK